MLALLRMSLDPFSFGPTGFSSLRGLTRTLLFLLLLAESLAAYPQRFEARLFGQDDGLDNLAISSIAQDPKGFLWVASQNGLFRYDGARFQSFGVPEGLNDPSVLTLFVDRKGNLWAGTHTGLFWFDGAAFEELKFKGASLRVGTNSMMASTKAGEVIVATPKDVFSIEQAPSDIREHRNWSIIPYRLRHPSFPKLEDMNGVGVDASDTFWIGCGEAICGFDDPNSQILEKEQGVPADFYMGFFLASDGRMYARGRKSIVTWKPGDKTVTDLTGHFPPNAMKTIHRRFTQDRFGRILTPTSSGFATWDGTRWIETNRSSMGDIDGAAELFSDREGNLWIGTQGSGLLESLGYGLWKNYGTAEGLNNPHIFALATDSFGSVQAGHDKGVSRLQLGATSFASSLVANDQDAAQIQSLVPSPDGGMWVGALLGHIFHVGADGKADIKIAFDTYIRRLRIDTAGTLWVGTSSGLYTLNCQAVAKCVPLAVPGLEKATIRDLAIDLKGAIWVTDETGIVLVRRSAASPTAVARVATSAELKDFDLVAPAKDGTLWLTSEKRGIFRIQIDPTNHPATAKIIESHLAAGLASSQIVSLDLDLAGRLWIGTDHGLNVLQDGKIEQINEDDGLIWNDIDSRAFMADPDGSIWIGTSHGISHLLNPAALFYRPPFAATIDIVQYNEKVLPSSASVLWDGGVTALHFSGLTFRDNRQLRYHYSLAGFDSASVLTHSPFVRFQKLPPGTYTFRVVAEDPVHGVFSAPAEFTFTLTPPWWRTNLFYALVTLLGICFVVLIWRWSQRALIAQRGKLQRLVAERTYELEQLAVRDSLTGLLNRNAIMTALTHEIQNAHKCKSPLCIALIDLDHFKQINDTLGHLAGDEVLRRSAERLRGAIRTSDAIGRYGGEEFLIIFRNVEQQFGVDRCEVVRNALCAEPIAYESHYLKVTCSIGVAWSGTTTDPLNGLVAKADRAMYLAKENGRNRTEYAIAD